MTEEEAKAKWCPFTRGHVPGGQVGINRGYDADVDVAIGSCIGSACMAWRTRPQWRWTDIEPPDWHDGVEPTSDMKEQRMAGFCGLAGVPK